MWMINATLLLLLLLLLLFQTYHLCLQVTSSDSSVSSSSCAINLTTNLAWATSWCIFNTRRIYNFIPSLPWQQQHQQPFNIYFRCYVAWVKIGSLVHIMYIQHFRSLPLPDVLLLQSPYISLPNCSCPFFSPMSFYYNLHTFLYPTVLAHSSPRCPSTTISLHFFTQLFLPILLPDVLLLQSPYISLPNCLCPFFSPYVLLLQSPYISLPNCLCPFFSPYVLLLQSPYISLPNCLCPFFQHAQPTSQHLCMQFLMLTNPRRLSSVTLHIHHIIIVSFLSTFTKSSSFTVHVNTPDTCHLTSIEDNTPDTCL